MSAHGSGSGRHGRTGTARYELHCHLDGSVRPEPTMDVGDAARAVAHMAGLPLDSNVLFMTIMATNMPYVGRG